MKKSNYIAKTPDANGFVKYDESENKIWQKLYERQIEIIKPKACDEFFEGVLKLNLKKNTIPQISDVSKTLKKHTGFTVAPVKALISFKEFFDLLANKTFPVATFIRREEDLDYLKEPDVFHEIFGHCPMLTNNDFANFTQRIGEIGQSMDKKEQVMLARLYWFTVEFGLIKTNNNIKIYGGGILSSKGESIYALESNVPIRHDFDLQKVLRTPYRYDEMQKDYFIIDSFKSLFNIVNRDLKKDFQEAMALGLISQAEIDNTDVRSC